VVFCLSQIWAPPPPCFYLLVAVPIWRGYDGHDEKWLLRAETGDTMTSGDLIQSRDDEEFPPIHSKLTASSVRLWPCLFQYTYRTREGWNLIPTVKGAAFLISATFIWLHIGGIAERNSPHTLCIPFCMLMKPKQYLAWLICTKKMVNLMLFGLLFLMFTLILVMQRKLHSGQGYLG
jgi:hypothetical protein